MASCAVISGGSFSPLAGIEKCERVIACDKGVEYALQCGITPDLIVGDFDSFRGNLPNGVEIKRLPTEKDDTDTVSAVREAVAAGFDEIVLYCALGGRLDHLFANIQTLAFIAEQGATARIIDGDTEMVAFSHASIEVPEKKGWSLSVFSLSDRCENVSIHGAKYCLDNATVSNRFPIGVSNEWDGTAAVSVGEGILAVMLCRIEKNE